MHAIGMWLSLHETESSARNILCGSGHTMAFFYAHITCSLGSPRGGGLNPEAEPETECYRNILCGSGHIMMACFYAH